MLFSPYIHVYRKEAWDKAEMKISTWMDLQVMIENNGKVEKKKSDVIQDRALALAASARLWIRSWQLNPIKMVCCPFFICNAMLP